MVARLNILNQFLFIYRRHCQVSQCWTWTIWVERRQRTLVTINCVVVRYRKAGRHQVLSYNGNASSSCGNVMWRRKWKKIAHSHHSPLPILSTTVRLLLVLYLKRAAHYIYCPSKWICEWMVMLCTFISSRGGSTILPFFATRKHNIPHTHPPERKHEMEQ